jgi:hypothetical protein
MSGSIIQGKRYPTSQRTLVLQFTTVEEADAWDRAGQPVTMIIPEVWVSHPAPEDEQNKGDDRQHNEDRPKHGRTVPAKRRRQPA